MYSRHQEDRRQISGTLSAEQGAQFVNMRVEMSPRASWFLNKCIYDFRNHPLDLENRFTFLEYYMLSLIRGQTS